MCCAVEKVINMAAAAAGGAKKLSLPNMNVTPNVTPPGRRKRRMSVRTFYWVMVNDKVIGGDFFILFVF